MTLGAPSTAFLAGLLRLTMAMAVFAVSLAMWSPDLASATDQGQGTGVAAVHPPQHGGPPGDASGGPRHAWACALVCASGGTCCPGVLGSPPLRMVASAPSPGRAVLRRGRTPDPAIPPPRVEAAS